jgi:hypothetical protein
MTVTHTVEVGDVIPVRLMSPLDVGDILYCLGMTEMGKQHRLKKRVEGVGLNHIRFTLIACWAEVYDFNAMRPVQLPGFQIGIMEAHYASPYQVS